MYIIHSSVDNQYNIIYNYCNTYIIIHLLIQYISTYRFTEYIQYLKNLGRYTYVIIRWTAATSVQPLLCWFAAAVAAAAHLSGKKLTLTHAYVKS